MSKTLIKFGSAHIGCVLDCSAQSADTLNERILSFAKSYGFTVFPDLPDDASEEYSDHLNEVADEAVEWLNEQDNAPYCNWNVEDNSLFYQPDVESARESVAFVSVKSLRDARGLNIETDPEDSTYPPADYRGEWLHVNDHGNATLYVRTAKGEDRELWAIV